MALQITGYYFAVNWNQERQLQNLQFPEKKTRVSQEVKSHGYMTKIPPYIYTANLGRKKKENCEST